MVEMNSDTDTMRCDIPQQNSDMDGSETQASDPESVGKQTISRDSGYLHCQNGEEESDKGSECHNSDNNPRKKKHRRGKRHSRKWKPYNKMSWSERQAVDERESRRATKKREDAFASGHPRAPFNTTQFLIDDHITYQSVPSPSSHDEVRHGNNKEPSTSCDSSEDYESTDDEEKKFIAREFSETYDNIHAERLQSMSKDCLIKEYIELESRLEQIQSKMKERQGNYNNKTNSNTKPDGLHSNHLNNSNEEEFMDCEKRILRDEIQRLLAENERLKTDIEKFSVT